MEKSEKRGVRPPFQTPRGFIYHSRCSFYLGGAGLGGCTSISEKAESIVPSFSILFSVDLEILHGLLLQGSTNEGKCRVGFNLGKLINSSPLASAVQASPLASRSRLHPRLRRGAATKILYFQFRFLIYIVENRCYTVNAVRQRRSSGASARPRGWYSE